jgi:hypothetical protein
MRLSSPPRARDPKGPLIAAAMLARDGRFTVRVVLPRTPQRVLEAEEAGEQAGVDVTVERTAACATVHFVARHQDRRLEPSAFRAKPLRPIVRSSPLGGTPRAGPRPPGEVRAAVQPGPPTTRPVDLVAFRHASDALALSHADDPEAQRIWNHLLQARARAHLCGGTPTLILNDIGGVVGLLRRRARTRGVAMRINPDACACG